MLTIMEAMTGTFYVAVLISRLVALYSRRPLSEPASPGKDLSPPADSDKRPPTATNSTTEEA
jgi:hypothetical protein